MGEREITERRTIEKTREVTACDFCGRDESKVDGSFDTVKKNPRFKENRISGHRLHSANREFIQKSEIELALREHSDETWHLCHDCSSAFTEVMDDDDD